VFGKVVEGMGVVDALVAIPTTAKRGHQDVPVDDVVIHKVEIIEA
jgi:peptidyl-prolyl cis-trans isomerase B (cyclophilin B)